MGIATGKGKFSPKPKIVLEKRGYFLRVYFPKIIYKFHFSFEFSSNILKVSANFPTICFYVQMREKLTHGWLF